MYQVHRRPVAPGFAGDAVADRIRIQPDPRIEALVLSWPAAFKTERAAKLGFTADSNVESIIRSYIEDQGIKV